MIDIAIYRLPNGEQLTYNKNLYILGTSNNGPILEPVLIKTPQQAKSIFGDSKKGTLVKAYNEAYQVGGTNVNIYLVRISGEDARLDLRGRDVNTGFSGKYIKLKSKYGGEIWNDARVYINGNSMEIMNPVDIGGEVSVFSFDAYPTIEELAREINIRARESNLQIIASALEPKRSTKDLVEYYKQYLYQGLELRYGEDGININKNQLHECLQIAYNILEGQPIDVLCVADMYFDDVYPAAYYGESKYGEVFFTGTRDYLTKAHPTIEDQTATFHGQMIDFCYRQASLSIITHGVIAFNPLENLEDIVDRNGYLTKAIYATAFSERFDLITKNGTKITDHGKFISVVAGEFEYESDGVKYYNNGYLGYAAFIASRLTPSSTTNKPIPNITNIRYHHDDSEIVQLSKLGIVTFRYSIMKKAIVVCNGVTAAIDTSPYHTLSNVRMVQLVTTAFRILLESFIGQDVTKLRSTNAINNALDALVIQLKSDGIVRDIKYNLRLVESGFAIINIDMLPYYSLEYVSASGSTKL